LGYSPPRRKKRREFYFFLLSAETPESKNPQALAGYDDLIRNYKRSLDYVFFAALLLSSFPLPGYLSR